MSSTAFCPAHITGFFRMEVGKTPETTGSVGAGFSITEGVTTTIDIDSAESPPRGIAEYVTEQFLDMIGEADRAVSIYHDAGVPSGYGLGSSGAVALSTAIALNGALGAGLDKEVLGQLAHRAEIHYNSGLGDVMAAYTGGFEIRISPGAPGYGAIRSINIGNVDALIVCLAPRSTSEILADTGLVNGIGGAMMRDMMACPDAETFQRLSMEFAIRSGLVTPDIWQVASQLGKLGIYCGVAMLGETVFALVNPKMADEAVGALDGYNTIRTRIDCEGARAL